MNQRVKGFTLIELLVVIAVISILATIVYASVSNQRLKARDAHRLDELGRMKRALTLYLDANNFYPLLPSTDCGTWNRSDAGASSSCWSELGTALNPWMPIFPVDPLNVTTGGNSYVYVYQAVKGGAGFRLGANLEANSVQGDGCSVGVTKPTGFPDSFYCVGDNWQ